MQIFIVTAYRWGNKECHSYVLGAFDNKETAIEQAIKEKEWRGGKYDCEVICMELNESLQYKNYEVVYKIPYPEQYNEKSSSKGVENT